MASYVSHDWYGSHVLEECKRLRKSLQHISKKYNAASSDIQSSNTLYPFVLLLGNHSSGKSSFINFLLGKHVQATGVAPTDDNFTIIAPGEDDIDRNGPALVGDPDLGFHSLANFGTTLVNHTQLKVRADIAIKDFMLVDSPGMIDSPMSNTNGNHMVTSSLSSTQGNMLVDRGYNFEAVCRWYAERADVILLFFDPDKPGTTGETLTILTTALNGLDHKLFIILNKADQFHRIHDFARAYGSLCWNLSKVIPRKDLPRIHTMCLPLSALPKLERTPSGNEVSALTRTFFEQGSSDLEETRNEIMKETFNAPKRRVDNEISRLNETVQGLLLHCSVVDKVIEKYNSKLWKARLLTLGSGLLSIGLTFSVSYICDFFLNDTNTTKLNNPEYLQTSPRISESQSVAVVANPVDLSQGLTAETVIDAVKEANASGSHLSEVISSLQTPKHDGTMIGAMLSSLKSWYWNYPKQACVTTAGIFGTFFTVGVFTYQSIKLQHIAEAYAKRDHLDQIVKDVYQKEKIGNDEVILGASENIISNLSTAITAETIPDLSRVHQLEFQALHRILKDDIARLRRQASPAFPTLTPTPQKIRGDDVPQLFDSPFNIRIAPFPVDNIEHSEKVEDDSHKEQDDLEGEHSITPNEEDDQGFVKSEKNTENIADVDNGNYTEETTSDIELVN